MERITIKTYYRLSYYSATSQLLTSVLLTFPIVYRFGVKWWTRHRLNVKIASVLLTAFLWKPLYCLQIFKFSFLRIVNIITENARN